MIQSADNPDQQVCYFNKPHDDMFYNVFISKRIKAESFDAKKRQKMAQAMTDFQSIHNFKAPRATRNRCKKTWRHY